MPTYPVVACGYEVSLDDFKKELGKVFPGKVFSGTSKMGLYFGTGSVGSPIFKDDPQIREWAESRVGQDSTLKMVALYVRGIVFVEFVDKDDVKFLGVLLNPNKDNVMKAKKDIANFLKIVVKPRDIVAKPYIWIRKNRSLSQHPDEVDRFVTCERSCHASWCTCNRDLNRWTDTDDQEWISEDDEDTESGRILRRV